METNTNTTKTTNIAHTTNATNANDFQITKETIKKVAENARLNLTETELDKFTKEIEEVIVNSFNSLSEMKIPSETQPSLQPIELKNKMRKDTPTKTLTQEEALQNVKQELREDGYIKGPKAL
jgi:aspartyl-tRNA(Asn)/glutamyl-tRNA(Gln) amidotransferase subunit C